MKTTNTTRTYPTQVSYSARTWYLIESASVTSPRTGLKLNLSRVALDMCPVAADKIKAVCGHGRGGSGIALFTLADFSEVLNAVEGARDAYKDSMSDHDCTSGMEETDGECEGCDRNRVVSWAR